MTQENRMKDIKIEKLVINLCVGESGDKLTKASKVKPFILGYGRFDRLRPRRLKGQIHY
jgi:hypothetical protein